MSPSLKLLAGAKERSNPYLPINTRQEKTVSPESPRCIITKGPVWGWTWRCPWKHGQLMEIIHKPSPQDSNTIMRSELYNCSAVFHVVNCTPKCLCTHIQGPHWPKCLCNSSTALIWPVEVEDIPRYCIIWCVMYVNASTDLVLTGNVTVLLNNSARSYTARWISATNQPITAHRFMQKLASRHQCVYS